MFNSLNIIGYGYVGSAIGYVCEKNNINFNVCDLQQKKGNFNFYTSNVESLITFSENENDMNYYFIAVPTPSNKDDSCNTSIIDNVLNTLNNKCTKKTIVLIKSTLVPGSCQTFHNKYTNLDIILLPEFLREASYKDDMYNADFVLIGLPQSICHNTEHWLLYEDLTNLCKRLYNHKDIEIYIKSYEECELFKYTLNVHLAVKVWYFNEIYEISEKLGVDYAKLQSLFNLDKRIGEYGTRVPGHDGKFGYGLSCLPKETRGMMKLQENLGIDNNVLKEIIKRNNYFRTK
jgi:UDPglucose 6-dehydrogenase